MEADLVGLGRAEAATLLGAHVDDGRAGQGERGAERLVERVQVVAGHDPDVGQAQVLEQLARLGQPDDRGAQPLRPLEQRPSPTTGTLSIVRS